jgi:hypothetical protein
MDKNNDEYTVGDIFFTNKKYLWYDQDGSAHIIHPYQKFVISKIYDETNIGYLAWIEMISKKATFIFNKKEMIENFLNKSQIRQYKLNKVKIISKNI